MPGFPFVGASYTARSNTFDCQRCVNLYPEMSGSGSSKSVAALIGTPGLSLWKTLDGGGIRGMIAFSASLAVVVSGNSVFTVTSDGMSAFVGYVSGSGSVDMASNGTDVMIACGPSAYFFNPITGTITAANGENFTGAECVDFVDGYFLFNKPNTGQFQISGLYSTTLDPLDFATAEGSPDNIVALIVDHREVWLMGERTTEVWFNSGDTDFPFSRISGSFIEHGCAAKRSVCKLDNSVFWLGADDKGNGMVFRANGYTPQRISTHAIEYAIGQYSRVDDAVAWTYQQEGHSFYVLNFPTANATWCFDASTSLWHERAWTETDGTLGRHRGECHMAFAGMNLVGDWQTGNIYALDLDVFTDNGNTIERIRACQHISNDMKRVMYSALQIDMEAGVGLSDGQGSDPQAMLQWSDDGGFTWSNEAWASIGKMGERKTRVRWRRLGKSRDRVFKLKISDPVKVVIVGATAETVSAGS